MEEKLFSDLEGLRIGMEMEVEGRDYYQQASEKVDNPEHKALFQLLKQEEMGHYEAFSKMYATVRENKQVESDEYLFDADSSRYLTVLVEDHIFPKKQRAQKAISEMKTTEDILRSAIEAEKNSILFYDELAAQSKFEDARKIFTALKAEEQTHVVKLTRLLVQLKG
ncbi:MAG TPA: ferritin family protein [Patescibacteria group bacterium]|nr:ferritin family protein [Patescibacteria group bacterium]